MVYTVITDNTPEQPQPHKDVSGFWNLDLELQAIKTMLTPESKWSEVVYSICKPEFFHHSATQAIYNRLRDVMKVSNAISLPSLDFILSDTKLPASVRQTLRETLDDDTACPISIVSSQGDYDILVNGLSTLAKTRAIYQATHKAATDLLDADEPTTVVTDIKTQLGHSLFNVDDDSDFITQVVIGRGYNQSAEDCFDRIIHGTFEGTKIKTGFSSFDNKTGGFHRTNLVIIGAGSGHGKSLLATNLLIRQYRLGYNVCLCSYEMTDDEVMLRVLSNISEVEMDHIQNNRLAPKEVKRITAAWREFNLLGHEKGNAYTIVCPKTETTVSEIGFRVRSLKPDVLILDYINLLSTSSASGRGEAQWQQLGDISRESKLLANKLNCVVILLAQIDDTYNLRYSKGIKDHANFVMGFIRDETAKTERIITIKQLKARNAPLYDFELLERFDIAQFRDLEQQNRSDWPDEDSLLMLELQCESLGLKLTPTSVKQFEAKRSKQVVNTHNEEAKIVISDTRTNKESLLYSADDALPSDFSKLPIKASTMSLLDINVTYDDDII